jgi:hypothetical protein
MSHCAAIRVSSLDVWTFILQQIVFKCMIIYIYVVHDLVSFLQFLFRRKKILNQVTPSRAGDGSCDGGVMIAVHLSSFCMKSFKFYW